ncbi:MAG: GerMN domain-containing protein [Acidobacteriota bacterium]
MIPRYQTILFFILLAASLVMGVVLWQLLERHHQRLLNGEDSAPTQAPLVTPAEPATLEAANDADNTLTAEVQSLPLPQSPGDRARAILNRLLALYAVPGSTHPVPGGANGVAQVFLLPAGGQGDHRHSGPELAVVNLTSAFAANHPSGLETETLTVLSICATLRANLPRVTEVRFLVDGQQRATLAGHVDLTRTYLTAAALPAAGVHP